MELIYLNNDMVEMGVIQDFKLNLAYGKDENDFEIKTPENEMEQKYYWYIPETEYGGVVDEVECLSNIQEVTYRGRSWQGLLGGFHASQIQTDLVMWSVSGDYITIKGTVRNILEAIVRSLQLPIVVIEDTVDDELDVVVGAYQSVYSLLNEIATKKRLKLKLYYENGLKIGLLNAIDYTAESYFDATQYSVKSMSSVKVPNHLIGIYKKDGGETIIKHIYTDEDGEVQPYFVLDEGHDVPLSNAEYLRCPDNKVVSGMNEIVEVIEGGNSVENYDLVKRLVGVNDEHPYGTSGNTPFSYNVPSDWNEKCYTDYYDKEYGEDGKPSYKNLVQEKEDGDFEPIVITDDNFNWWRQHWGDYYKRTWNEEESKWDWKQLSDEDISDNKSYFEATPDVRTWANDYKDYFYRVLEDNVWKYYSVEGVSVEDPIRQNTKQAPDAWSTDKENFKRYWNKPKWKVTIYVNKKKNGTKWVYSTTKYFENTTKNADKISAGPERSLYDLMSKNQKKGNFTTSQKLYFGNAVKYVIHPKTTTKVFITVKEYANLRRMKLKDVKYKAKTYYRIDTKTVAPPWNVSQGRDGKFYLLAHTYDAPVKSTYYKWTDKIKPEFKSWYYVKVVDDYTSLCEKMIEKLNELKENSQKIEPDIDTELQEFDVGDIIGGTHPFTKEVMTSTITKKIVDADANGVKVSYEIG